jgi:hypothetical protein
MGHQDATLWRYSLASLIAQYLSGIDSAERDAFLAQAKAIKVALWNRSPGKTNGQVR